jgi:hypothetical protein
MPPAANRANRATEATLKGASRRTAPESTRMGVINAAMASARHTLAIIDPTRLPTANWDERRNVARAATTSSAMLVPSPPTSAPTTVGRIRRTPAMRARATMN